MNSQSTVSVLSDNPDAYAVWAYALNVLESGRLFKNATVGELMATLLDAAKRNSLFWVKQEDTVEGLALVTANHAIRHVEVDNWIADNKQALKRLIKEFQTKWPGYSVGGHHKTKRIHITPAQQTRYFNQLTKD